MSALVLLVDPDVTIGRALGRRLKASGLNLEQVGDQPSALARASFRAYDAFIVDSDVADDDGMRLLDLLHRMQPEAACALTTAGRDLDLLVRAVNEHAVTGVLLKPWRPEELDALLARVRPHLTASVTPVATDEEAIEVLRGVMRARDSRLHRRSLCVARIAHLLAVELDVAGAELASLVQASLLSDVGMVSVPEEVLQKNGPLDAGERELVRAHIHAGSRLFAALGRLDAACDIVAQHHERWDGAGYPHGRHGYDILLGARILAVADALDAMVTDRPYRKGLPVAAAVAEVCRHAGTQFDPGVAEVLARLPLDKVGACLRGDEPSPATA
jgi:response regulator RpfG family c-di-GMP phosphodiesterase